MPVQLDYDVARRRFAEALDLAKSEAVLPEKWAEHTRAVAAAGSKTFTPVLGTALLAKATDAKADALSLKVRDHPRAYSARALAKDVLVPCATMARVNLRTEGPEPLNNQPFFRHESMSPDMVVRPKVKKDLRYLCDCLEEADKLSGPDALQALAAFLRTRLREGGGSDRAPDLGERVLGVDELAAAATKFVVSKPEEGRRGQALVAAALSLRFEDVRTARINDPSRHWPGDVAVFEDDRVVLAAEAKQRSVPAGEILQFAERCARDGVRRAVVAALAPGQEALPLDELYLEAWRRYGVHLVVFLTVRDLLNEVLMWGTDSLDTALATFPGLMMERLKQLEGSAEGLAEWAALFDEPEA
jgi:hypothetical protein